jgi:hypothetical protein
MTGATQREAQLTWQRLEGWLDFHDRVSNAAIERHPKKVAEYLSLARGFVPPGWVVEVTLRTKGGVYRRDGKRVKDRRPLYLKIIVTAREALPIAEHERAVRLTLRAGAVPQGFKIKYADWEKGQAYGRISRVSDLIAFYGAVRHPNTEIRADMVAREEEL